MGEQETFDLIDLDGPAWVRLESAAFRMGSDSGRDDSLSSKIPAAIVLVPSDFVGERSR